ncbi:MAG: hypothetical protein IT449_02405 [Phycisphaerales bacterium]|nr:hypothetical protein [Phycisphaerales bacterium]
MPLSDCDVSIISSFRDWLDARRASGGDPSLRDDRADGSSLLTRFPAGPQTWLEVAVRPYIPQVRVGIVTDDRWKNEELEEAVESTGDTMSEFVEAGFHEVDLDWRDPPVEHYRDRGKDFTFATPLDLSSMDDLSRDDVRTRVWKMVEGYRTAFAAALTKPV